VEDRNFSTGLRGAGTELDQLQRKQAKFTAIGAAAGLAFGAGVKFLGDSLAEAGSDQERFARAVGNFKGKFPLKDMQDFTGGLQELTGIEDDVIAQSLGLLGTFGLTAREAKNLELPILNATAALKAQGMTAESVSVQIGKALESGNAGPLRRAGIIIDPDTFKNADRIERVRMLIEALQRQGGDAAITFKNVLPGGIQTFNTELNTLQGTAGAFLQGPAKGVVDFGVNVLKTFNQAPEPVQKTATVIGVAAVGALGALSLGAGIAAWNLGRLIKENVRLTNEMLKGADAANKQANALNRVGGAGGGRGGGGGLPGGIPSGKGGGGGWKATAKNVGTTIGIELGLEWLQQQVGQADWSKNATPQQGAKNAIKNVLNRAMRGAQIGQPFGMGIPGAVIGGIVGSVEDILHGTGLLKGPGGKAPVKAPGTPASTPAPTPADAELKRIRELLQAMHDQNKGPLSDADVPRMQQAMAAMGRRSFA
jgi:hypothetical protein